MKYGFHAFKHTFTFIASVKVVSDQPTPADLICQDVERLHDDLDRITLPLDVPDEYDRRRNYSRAIELHTKVDRAMQDLKPFTGRRVRQARKQLEAMRVWLLVEVFGVSPESLYKRECA